jgi:hypothetical protein
MTYAAIRFIRTAAYALSVTKRNEKITTELQILVVSQLRGFWSLPIAVPSVRSQVRSCGICGTDAGFTRVLWFHLPILIPPTVPSSYRRSYIASIKNLLLERIEEIGKSVLTG